jgi:amidase
MSDSLSLDRRGFISALSAAAAASQLPLKAAPSPAVERLALHEQLEGIRAKRYTVAALTSAYLARIKRWDPKVRSVVEINPDALVQAKALDVKSGQEPLCGAIVMLKDNVDTADRMRTTAGSLALMHAPAPHADAFIVQRLRHAGALLLGKTNLSEWANFRSTHSISGWSGRGGLTRNPHALDRNTSGSSSGSAAAVAAGFCAASIGTETDGSIVSPANNCGVVGLKPTLGLVSRSGIIPIAASQDTAGPMARCVRDAALILNVIAGSDPHDPATAEADAKREKDYAADLKADGLKGVRLGWLKATVEQHPGVAAAFGAVATTLRGSGAECVDVELPATFAMEAAELEVLLFEFKAQLNAYLSRRGGDVKDLASLIAFNRREAAKEMPLFAQELLEQAEAKGPLTDPAYLKAKATCAEARGLLVDLLDKQKLDAVVGPTGSPAWLIDPINGDHYGFGLSTLPAIAGTPHLTVPAVWVHGLPVGLSFIGRPWSEGPLLRMGYAFEQATRAFRLASLKPSAA